MLNLGSVASMIRFKLPKTKTLPGWQTIHLCYRKWWGDILLSHVDLDSQISLLVLSVCFLFLLCFFSIETFPVLVDICVNIFV